MIQEYIEYHRDLPHFQPAKATFFITFRLAGSLPKEVIVKLKSVYEHKLKRLNKTAPNNTLLERKYALTKSYWGIFDTILDTTDFGAHWLKDIEISKIVADKIHAFDKKRYHLIAYCIMTNHVHLLIDTDGFHFKIDKNSLGKTSNYPLADTMRLLKGSTGRQCNIVLGRTGSFWQKESYDHCVRNTEELQKIIKYILHNPVKAGFVERWKDWPFTYLEEFST